MEIKIEPPKGRLLLKEKEARKLAEHIRAAFLLNPGLWEEYREWEEKEGWKYDKGNNNTGVGTAAAHGLVC